MSNVTQNYEQLARSMGMYTDGAVLYGVRGGYELCIYAADSRYPYMLTVSLSAKPQNGIPFSKEEKKQFAKDLKPVSVLNQQGNLVLLYLFTLGGAIPTIISVLDDLKNKSVIRQIGSAI